MDAVSDTRDRTHSEEVRRYYEATARDYHLVWTGADDLALHYGYSDETVHSHAESLLRLNEVTAAEVGVSVADHVLDAGCGYGGSAIWLAGHIGCRVTGISIVGFQVERARAAAATRGVGDLTAFFQRDFSATGFADETFDVVWACERFVHAAERGAALAESGRVLRAGGRLVIVEFLLRDRQLSPADKEFIRPVLDGWAMPRLLAADEYREALAEAGFTDVVVRDVTANMIPSVERLRKAALGAFGERLARALHRTGLLSTQRLANVVATQRIAEAFRRGLLRYAIVSARRAPGGLSAVSTKAAQDHVAAVPSLTPVTRPAVPMSGDAALASAFLLMVAGLAAVLQRAAAPLRNPAGAVGLVGVPALLAAATLPALPPLPEPTISTGNAVRVRAVRAGLLAAGYLGAWTLIGGLAATAAASVTRVGPRNGARAVRATLLCAAGAHRLVALSPNASQPGPLGAPALLQPTGRPWAVGARHVGAVASQHGSLLAAAVPLVATRAEWAVALAVAAALDRTRLARHARIAGGVALLVTAVPRWRKEAQQ